MNIHWFPKHMATAKRQIAEALPRCDVVLEVLDARCPAASSNAMLADLSKGKPALKLLAKPDLADPEVTEDWIHHLQLAEDVMALPIDARSYQDARRIPESCRRLAPERARLKRPIRIMVLGMPNVGKSTLINTLAGRKVAKVGDEPAITKGQQRVELKGRLQMVDTPGVLLPKLDDRDAAYRLAASGAIRDAAVDYSDVALFAVDYLARHYPGLLKARFRLQEVSEDAVENLREIGRRRGCLVKGGEVDFGKAGEILLRDLRSGRIGRISLEKPVTAGD